jgi:hypothetical protein
MLTTTVFDEQAGKTTLTSHEPLRLEGDSRRGAQVAHGAWLGAGYSRLAELKRWSHERDALSTPRSSTHRRRARGLARDYHSLHRHRRSAARNRRLPAVGPTDGRRVLPACDSLSHCLRRRGQLYRGAARARSAHDACPGLGCRGPCREHRGRCGDVNEGPASGLNGIHWRSSRSRCRAPG